MAPKGEQDSFRVVDRRRFTREGEPAPEPAAPPPRDEAGKPPEAEPSPTARGPRAELPPASFPALVQMLAMSALDALGAIARPDGERPPVDLALARHGIDLLGVLEAKTRGNLTPDESRLLEQTLFDLRMLAVRVASGRS